MISNKREPCKAEKKINRRLLYYVTVGRLRTISASRIRVFVAVNVLFGEQPPTFRNTVAILLAWKMNLLTPNDPYRGRTAPLTSKSCILYIYSTNIGTEYFKHGIYSPFFHLQNAVCFIILTYLVPVLFTFYVFIQQIQVPNILNTVYTLRFFPFKMQFVS